jgi:hypothetical protein
VATNQEGRHAKVRALSGTTGTYNEDWHALFTADGITANRCFNERMLAWINVTLSTSYTSLPQAMTAFGIAKGFTNWDAMNTWS